MPSSLKRTAGEEPRCTNGTRQDGALDTGGLSALEEVGEALAAVLSYVWCWAHQPQGRLGHLWLTVGRGSFVFQAREAAGEYDVRKGRFLQGGGGVFSWTPSHCVDGLG